MTGKRLQDIEKKIDRTKEYNLEEAIKVIKENANAKYDESVDIAINLNIDTKKTDQNVRGSVALPHGTGRTCIIAVFAKGDKAEEAKKNGADIVGSDDLVQQILDGNINFDACVATPDMMPVIGRVARVLGPRGLMPNPKLGTVTNDVAGIIASLKAGRVNFKNDKGGVIHSAIGKVSFDPKKLMENARFFIENIKQSRPSGAKGHFVKSMYLTSTQGVSLMFNEN